MGKTRGHGSRRGAYRGRGRGRGGDDSDEDEVEPQRGLGGQSSTVGMLPPSDSDEDEGEKKEEGKADTTAEKKAPKPKGQSSKVGMLPPSGSEDEDEDEDDEDSEEDSEEAPMPEYLTQAAPRKKKQEEDDEPDPEQIKKDLERLQLIKEKREQDRLKRIRDEGWDRFAPVSETNKPPGHLPADHPCMKQEV